MINKKILFGFGLVLLFTGSAVSCIEVDKSLGKNLIPSDNELTVNSAEFSLPVQMKMSDSLQTIFSGYIMFGAYKDPLFGLVNAGGAFSISPGTTENDFGENPTVNYFRMYITVNSHSYLNSWEGTIPQNVYVYKMNSDLDTLKPYNISYNSGDYDPVPINDKTVYFSGDSIVCNIDKAYARDLLTATQLERDSVKYFVKRFKGMYISTDPMPGSLTGGRFNLISASGIYFALSYRHVDTENNIDKDSIVYYYSDDTYPYINSITHSSKNLETTLPSQNVYMEGLAGIKPYIDFSKVETDIKDWANTKGIDIKKIIISKAEIVLPFEFPADYKVMNQYPSQIFLVTRVKDTTDNLIYYRPISDLNIEGSDGSANRVNFEYRMNVTTYIQKLITDRFTDAAYNKAWIFPILSTSNSYTGATSYYVENTTYYKGVFNGNLAQRAPKLLITYAVLK